MLADILSCSFNGQMTYCLYFFYMFFHIYFGISKLIYTFVDNLWCANDDISQVNTSPIIYYPIKCQVEGDDGRKNRNMRKTLIINGLMLLVALFLTMHTTEANARMDNPFKKETKKTAKALRDGGWKVFGGNRSIREALDAHYQALAEGQGRLTPIEAHARAKEINLAIRKSQNYAAQQLASMRETNVEGVTETKIQNSSSDATSSNVDFSANFKSSTSQTVKSLNPTVVFFRTLDNGWIEVRAFYLIDINE